jgi:uncharacterized protein YndB with AHSA1/START domain
MILAIDPTATPANEIVLTRPFAAPPDLVFRLWTDPRYVALWWGVKGARSVVRQMDVRPGGRWRIDMIVPSGTKYPNSGEFLEVVESRRLSYSDEPSCESPAWGGEPPNPTIHTVDFEPTAEGTLVRLTVRFQSKSDMERMVATGFERGVAQGLDRLAALIDDLAANQGTSK